MPVGLYVSKWKCWEQTLAGTFPPGDKSSARLQSWKRPLWPWHYTSRDGGFWYKEGGKRGVGDRSPQTKKRHVSPPYYYAEIPFTHIYHGINTFLPKLNTSPLRILPCGQCDLEPQAIALITIDLVTQCKFARCFDNVDIRYRRRRTVLGLVLCERLEDVCEAEFVVGGTEAFSFSACSVRALQLLGLRPSRGEVGAGSGGGGKRPTRGICAKAACAAEPEHFWVVNRLLVCCFQLFLLR